MRSDLWVNKIVEKYLNQFHVSFHLFSLWTRPLHPGIKQPPLVKLEIQRASPLVLKHSKIWKSLHKLKISPLRNMSISRILETCFQKTVSLLNMTGAAAGLIKKENIFFAIQNNWELKPAISALDLRESTYKFNQWRWQNILARSSLFILHRMIPSLRSCFHNPE